MSPSPAHNAGPGHGMLDASRRNRLPWGLSNPVVSFGSWASEEPSASLCRWTVRHSPRVNPLLHRVEVPLFGLFLLLLGAANGSPNDRKANTPNNRCSHLRLRGV